MYGLTQPIAPPFPPGQSPEDTPFGPIRPRDREVYICTLAGLTLQASPGSAGTS